MLKNLRNRLSDNKGFSLVELIVVITIMVILIAILVPNITGYINKSRTVANSAAAKTVYDAAYAYQTELIGQNKAATSIDDNFTAAIKDDIGNVELGTPGDTAPGKVELKIAEADNTPEGFKKGELYVVYYSYDKLASDYEYAKEGDNLPIYPQRKASS